VLHHLDGVGGGDFWWNGTGSVGRVGGGGVFEAGGVEECTVKKGSRVSRLQPGCH
jgi:hypothetical protein